jgi:putative MATE family efflux protein
MATSFFQMAFNLTDMFWLGRLGSGSVAAAGTAGLYLWLSMAFIWVGRMGAQIGVSQNMGRGDVETAKKFAQNSFVVSLILGTAYGIAMLLLQRPLIAFFNIDDASVVLQAQQYLAATAFAMPFIFAHQVITGVFIGFGNTKIPFLVNSFGLAFNIALTPILIFTAGWGIIGAGIATVISSILNLALKVWAMKRYKKRPFDDFKALGVSKSRVCKNTVKQIFRWGTPIGVESALFTLLFMIVSRLIAQFGVGAIAAQRVGSQVESLAWMMSGGFASAVTAFMGQNFGAKQYSRMRKAYTISIAVMGSYGIIVSVILFTLAEPLIGIFLQDPAEIAMGATYLRFFALTTTLSCMEEVAGGSFRGRGQTRNPAIVSITCNTLRVLLSYAIVHTTTLGLNGIWLGIIISVSIRSIWMLTWYRIDTSKKLPEGP